MKKMTLKMVSKASILFLAFSVVFFVVAVCVSNNRGRRVEPPHTIGEAAFPKNSAAPEPTGSVQKQVVVLDAGHGRPSSEMSDEEKTAEGYEYNENTREWGEWRHYKDNAFGEDCHSCDKPCPADASCWYAMGNADRETEPELNLNNAFAAKKYLEKLGYDVRMTRTSNADNPSMNKRVSYCFPDNDIKKSPDAAAYVCVHSNAGGGRGTSYISVTDGNHIEASNDMGRLINDKIAAATGLSNNVPIDTPHLVLFNKCPVPIAYLEIGFYDDASDLAILKDQSDSIGKAIAQGVDEYLKNIR